MQSAILINLFSNIFIKKPTLQYITYVETFLFLVYSKINFKTYISIEPIILHDKKVTQYLKHVKIQWFYNYLFELI